jgi:hypothetical protein
VADQTHRSDHASELEKASYYGIPVERLAKPVAAPVVEPSSIPQGIEIASPIDRIPSSMEIWNVIEFWLHDVVDGYWAAPDIVTEIMALQVACRHQAETERERFDHATKHFMEAMSSLGKA